MTRRAAPAPSGRVTLHGAAEDVSPAGVVRGPSAGPGEADEPGHGVRTSPETADRLLHLPPGEDPGPSHIRPGCGASVPLILYRGAVVCLFVFLLTTKTIHLKQGIIESCTCSMPEAPSAASRITMEIPHDEL